MARKTFVSWVVVNWQNGDMRFVRRIPRLNVFEAATKLTVRVDVPEPQSIPALCVDIAIPKASLESVQAVGQEDGTGTEHP